MKKILFVFTFFFLTLVFTKPTFAHILKTDGSIGAVLHIDPEDDPVIGSPSHVFFEVKDKENKFELKNCDCKILVLRAGKEIYSENISPNQENLTMSYAFTDKDVYQIQLAGDPITPNSFQSFSLIYDVRVSREPKDVEKKFPISSNLVYTAGTLIFVLILIIFLKRKGGDDK